MASFDPMLDLMRPQVSGSVPERTLRWAALRAARRFCMESRAYRRWIDVDLKAGFSTYELDAATSFILTDAQLDDLGTVEVIGLRAVEVDGKPYDPIASEDREGYGQYEFFPLSTVRIFPPPSCDAVGAMKVRVIVQPTLASTGLPLDFMGRFSEQVCGGAIAMLKEMKNEAWSDPVGAREHYMAFQADIATARARGDLENRTRNLRVRMHN